MWYNLFFLSSRDFKDNFIFLKWIWFQLYHHLILLTILTIYKKKQFPVNMWFEMNSICENVNLICKRMNLKCKSICEIVSFWILIHSIESQYLSCNISETSFS